MAGNASPDPAVSSEDSTVSTSGRSVDGEGGDSVGVEGILSRLDKERRLSFAPGTRDKGMSGRVSQWTVEHDPGDSGVFKEKDQEYVFFKAAAATSMHGVYEEVLEASWQEAEYIFYSPIILLQDYDW